MYKQSIAFVRASVFALLAPTFLDSRMLLAQSQFEPGLPFAEDIVLSDLPPSTAVAFGPDNRIFIAIKDGIVRVAQKGTLLPTPFIDISAMTNRRTDRGLGGIALDPQFPTKPYVYLFFTYDPPERIADESAPRVSRLIRVQADSTKNFNVAKADTIEIILGKNSVTQNIASQLALGATIVPEPASCMTGLTMDGTPIEDCIPSDENSHTAGTLIFSSDGSLYASHGDGAPYSGATKVSLRSQNLDSPSGKVLRINPETGEGLPGNPFFDPSNPGSNRSKVWSYGMRNPFRITVNPANGQIYVGDVGSSTWEEVNAGKGANYGWPCYEGGAIETDPAIVNKGTGNTISRPSTGFANFSRTKPFCTALANTIPSPVTAPLFSYKHPLDEEGKDLGAAITGIAFYPGTIYPATYRGALFIADYAQHAIRYLTFDSNGFPTFHPFATEVSGSGAVQLLAGPDTNIYALFLDLVTKKSQLRRFRFTGLFNSPPTVSASADVRAGAIPLAVHFRSDGTIDPDGQALTYRWDFGDGSTATEPHPTHLYRRVGPFEAVLTVKETTAPFQESSTSLTIRPGFSPPRAIIDQPVAGRTFRIGDRIQFSGHADFGGGNSQGATLSWSVLQQHNEHEHLLTEVVGSSGEVELTEHADRIAYIFCLSTTAGEGLDDQQCITLQPEVAHYTFASDPVGAPIDYIDEAVEALAPYQAQPIVNSSQTITAPAQHANRTFAGWSDGVTTQERTFVTEPGSKTFTALYQNLPPTAVATDRIADVTSPLTALFDGTASSDAEGDLADYEWTFADGTTQSGSVVRKRFPGSGTYTARLIVTDKLGATGTADTTITLENIVIPTPAPVNPTPAPVNTEIAFSLKRRGAASCGGTRRPCSPARGAPVVVVGEIPTGALVRNALILVIERKNRRDFKPLRSRTLKRLANGNYQTRISQATLAKGFQYRLSIVMPDVDGKASSRSRFRFVKVS